MSLSLNDTNLCIDVRDEVFFVYLFDRHTNSSMFFDCRRRLVRCCDDAACAATFDDAHSLAIVGVAASRLRSVLADKWFVDRNTDTSRHSPFGA